MTTTHARVYVGTYGKYNSGSIKGAWLNLDDYADKEDFLKACAELHNDEHDPELMFQDHEGIPEGMISESSINEEVWDFLAMSDEEQELLTLYRAEIDSDATLETAQENYAGTFNSEEDWAYDYIESTGLLHDCPDTLKNYFDYEAYARDARLGGDMTFVRHNGDVWAFYNR